MPYSSPPLAYASPSLHPPRSAWVWIKWVLIGALILVAGGWYLLSSRRGPVAPEIPLSEFEQMLLDRKIMSVTVEGDTVYGKFTQPEFIALARGGTTKDTQFRTELPAGTAGNWAFLQWLLNNRGSASVGVANDSSFLMQMAVPLIPWVLIFSFVAFILRRYTRLLLVMRQEPTKVIVLKPEETLAPHVH